MQRPYKLTAGLLTAVALGLALAQADGRHVVRAASAATALAQQTITVAGSGSVTVVPDVADVNLGVIAQAKDAATAMTEDSQHMAAVVAALEQAGLAAQDIRTSGLSLSPQYRNGPGAGSGVITGFRAANTVEVTVHQASTVGAVIDSALQAGANTIEGIDFVVSNPAAARAQAYGQAVADAKASALAIASAAGLQITGVQSISAVSTCCGGPVFAAAAEAAPAGPPILAGQQTVRVSLQVVYDVAP